MKRHAKKDQVTIYPNKSYIVLLNGHKSISKKTFTYDMYHCQKILCIWEVFIPKQWKTV